MATYQIFMWVLRVVLSPKLVNVSYYCYSIIFEMKKRGGKSAHVELGKDW